MSNRCLCPQFSLQRASTTQAQNRYHKAMSTTLPSQVAALDAVDERKVMEIDLTWQMACASMTANNNQIVINAQVYHTIGRTGLEELKLRLRLVCAYQLSIDNR